MHEKCRHFKKSDVFDLVLTEQLGSFFQTTIMNVRIQLNIDSIDYSAIYAHLNRFYYLTSLTVRFSGPTTTKIAYSFLSSIPMAHNSTVDLFIEDEHNNAVMAQIASSHSRKDIDVKKASNRSSYSDKKRRTPSPIRKAIESVKKLKTLYFEQQEGKNDDTESEDIPAAAGHDMLLKDVQSQQDAENNIKTIIAPKLLETVIAFQKNWIFATQFEAYGTGRKVHPPWNGPAGSSTPLVTLISIILSHISHQKEFDNADYDLIMKLFKALPKLKDWPNCNQIKNFETVKNRLVANERNSDLINLAEYMGKIVI
ncbi:hypothetical protein BDF20DRAFT_837679 [Mycotypha africana]|uniref:uncharacterized protein n=1 Tax=Mycotypha africana TaxID=64632 RepID=UPI002301C49D|nr:uncharacterized protein BDF20DRAFT_837679 [Mycotypha africana]KAI8973769.1 hypothetical protein BDF20DRAFT_837679 [Mycotypha africana]